MTQQVYGAKASASEELFLAEWPPFPDRLPGAATIPNLNLTDPFAPATFFAVNTSQGPGKTVRVGQAAHGLQDNRASFEPWFDMMHVLPRTLILGQVLSTMTIPFTVHNAFRNKTVLWDDFINNAGEGVDLDGTLPPATLPSHTSITDLILTITTDGPPSVDDELGFIFEFDVADIEIPIVFSRLVFFPFEPEEELIEELEWLTEIMEAKDGREKRLALRLYPRQRFILEIKPLGSEMARLHSFLLARPGATFGIPLWHESTRVTTVHAAGATVVNVLTTAFRDFRVGETAVIYESETLYDVFEVNAKAGATLTPTNPLVNAYSLAAIVMPVRYGQIGSSQRGVRWRKEMGRTTIQFEVTDRVNAVVPSTAAFASHNSKVLLDDDNAAHRQDTVDESFESNLMVFDSLVGRIYQDSLPAFARYIGHKGWYPSGMQKLWEIRQLLHSLRGRQVSFYMPTHRDDLVVTTQLNISTDQMVVEAAGLVYLAGQTFRIRIRVTLTDGSQLFRVIEDVDVDGNTEILTLDTTWAANIPVASIQRVEFIQKVRFDSDKVVIRYAPGTEGGRISLPVRTVIE